MSDPRLSVAAFETLIESHLLGNGYVRIAREGIDRERAIFPETAKLAALRVAAERTIELLKERRASLIAAAVTGRIAVGGEIA